MVVYDNVKELCEKKNITVKELEKKAGLGNGVIGGWRTAMPNTKSLKAVADVFKVSVNRLLKE